MLTCERIRAGDLTDHDLALWRAMQVETPAFRSPLLSPDFVQAVAAVRDDVRVIVVRRDGKTIGFLPVHIRPGALARPAGAPFSDYSALITHPLPGLRIGAVLKAAGITSYQAIGLVDPYNVFGETPGAESDDAFAIDLSLGDTSNNAFKKLLKNIRRLTRNIEEAHGPLRFIVGDRDPTHFDAMIALKRQQTHDTGVHDFLAAEWVQRLFANLMAAPDTGLHGFMLTLTAGDTPALYHFGVRLGDRAHPWVSSYDPAFSAFSPGQLFLNLCPEPLKEAGISYYDLSTGDQKYKAIFSNTTFPVRHARIYSDAPPAQLQARLERITRDTRKALGPRIDEAVARLNRRFDHIATLELDTLSRVRGVAYAFSNAAKRQRVHQG
jgi:CelD/BcsL family acetyltransferase involved in cellulose biosynthesis